MNRIPVRSSNLRSVGYQNGVLEIQFHNGAIYQYFDVPIELANELMRARSKGSFFKQEIEPFAKRRLWKTY